MAQRPQNIFGIFSVTLIAMVEVKVIPTCVGFIMDGNRRWAKAQGLPTLEGHRKGAEVFGDTIKWLQESGVAHGVYYAFSTENWQRDKAEVGYLMDLFREVLRTTAKEHGVRLRVVGRVNDFADDIQKQISEIESETAAQEYTTTIWVALSYGGRAEIVAAVNEAIARGEKVTEESFEKILWTAKMPDPDIIVRTGGEQRLSNFMTWKSVYSEFLFLEKPWPALTKADFIGILDAYGNRERRKGK